MRCSLPNIVVVTLLLWSFLLHPYPHSSSCYGTEAASLPTPPTTFLPLHDYYQYILQLRTHVPDLISPLFTYGRSYEGKVLQGVCIGPCTLATVPAQLITAMHHGREPMGAIATLHFLKDLIEQYLLPNPSIVALLRTRRLYVILSINPDAYQYNLDHRTNNQIMARKNRHDECDRHRSYVDTGTDLNRNYDFAWNIDDVGSSPLPCAEDYRGSRPFSEPETAAIQKLLTDYVPQTEDGTILDTIVPLYINSTIVINWHSYARFINLPYAVSSLPLPPENIYNGLLSIAEGMSKASGYGFGHPWTGGLYTCNGEASDWMIANRNLYAFSPEIGPNIEYEPFQTGMWPTNTLIPPILHDALPLLAYSYKVTNAYLVIPQHKVTVSAPIDSTRVCGSTGEYVCVVRKLSFELANKGIWKNKGKISISSMHHTGLTVPLNYYTTPDTVSTEEATDDSKKERNTIHIDKLENYLFSSSASSTETINSNDQQLQQHRACYRDFVSSVIANDSTEPNSIRRQLSSTVTNGQPSYPYQRPTIPMNIVTEIQTLLRSINTNRTEKWDMRTTLDNLRKQYTVHDSQTISSSLLRQLGDYNGSPSSPFVYSSLPYVYGYQGISKVPSALQEFHSYGESVISLSIDIPFPQPAAGGSFPDGTALATNAYGHWGYVSINDENTCTIYGIQVPSSLTDISSAATLEEVYTGLSTCFPCAAFRHKAYSTGNDNIVVPSVSPSPVVTSTNSPSSEGTTKEPWKIIVFPGSESTNDLTEGNQNTDDIWPWSTSRSLNSVSVQISLVIVGSVVAISIFILRSRNIIQFRLLRSNTRGSTGNENEYSGNNRSRNNGNNHGMPIAVVTNR